MLKWIIVFIFTMLNAAYASPSEPVVYTEDKLAITVTKDQPEFIIRLKANPTTGYNWFLRTYDNKIITPLKHHYEAPNSRLMGASGYDVWVFSVKPNGFTVPQTTEISFTYSRPWELDKQNKVLSYKIYTR